MIKLLLIRHAETDSVGKSITGWMPGWRLNRAGKEQAEQLAARLSALTIDAIYSSPLERALETAEPIARAQKLEVRPSNDLGEFRVGEWEGRSFEELERDENWRRFNAFRSTLRPPGGETMLEVQTRMMRALECFHEMWGGQSWPQPASQPARVAVVSHADPLRTVLAHFLGLPLDLALRLEISPASVSVVEWNDWAPRVLCVNETGEVPS